jgi:MATE family multidrug resistance protein
VTIAPAFIYSILLWGIGLAGGYQLAFNGLGPFNPMPNAEAFWLMSILGLILVSICLLMLIRYHFKQLNKAEWRT